MRFFRVLLLMLSVIGVVIPAQAQTQNYFLAWIPADFDGVITVNNTDDAAAFRLRILTFVGQFFQPSRLTYSQDISIDTFFTADALSADGATFSTNIFPWVSGEIIVAYHDLGESLAATSAETVLILPTADTFAAAAALRDIINVQDSVSQTSYRGVTVYQGDVWAFAFLPDAAVIGAADRVRDVLDTAFEQSDSLVNTSGYAAIHSALSGASGAGGISVYLNGDAAARAIPFFTSGAVDSAQPILRAFSETLSAVSDSTALESALIGGAIDGVGVQVQVIEFGGLPVSVQASAAAHLITPIDDTGAAFDRSLLNYIPRSAAAVVSGSDGRAALASMISGAALYQYAGAALNGFPVAVAAAARTSTDQLAQPTSADTQAALTGFFTALETIGGVDIQTDLLNHVSGSYAAAILPRPNNPLPVLNSAYDLLFTAQTVQPARAINALLDVITAYLGADAITETTIDGVRFFSVNTATGEPIFRFGANGEVVIAGTGQSIDAAMAAYSGEFRLIDEERWITLNQTLTPNWYIDMNGIFSALLPGSVPTGGVPLSQLGIETRLSDSQTLIASLVIAIPSS